MSMPFRKKPFTFTQPDGSQLNVVGWGDQHRARFETTDGFTVVNDPTTGYLEYAKPGLDGDLEPTGLTPGAVSPVAAGIAPNLRPSAEVTRAQVFEGRGLDSGRSRWQARRKELRRPPAEGLHLAPPKRGTVGAFQGLCLLIDFPDVRGSITREEVEAFCNEPGYSGFRNNGSVYDYFLETSNKRFSYKNVVAPYYTAKSPRSYYTDPKVPQATRTRELILEALTHFKSSGFNFSTLSTDNANYIYALNVFYAGPVVNNWSEGLWPHAYHLMTAFDVGGGKLAHDYQITNMGSELTLGTFCHENGHMVCDFPDLYDYGYESNGVGVYCLMCSGANADPKNPTQVGAYLKYKAGWANSMTTLAPGTPGSAVAGTNDFFIHRNNASEYYLIENRQRTGRDRALTSGGLAIWHIDERGDNSDEQMSASQHYECALIQADGKLDLEKGTNEGDLSDLFHSNSSAVFSDAKAPRALWWDGNSSRLHITKIGVSGLTIAFTVV